MKFIELIHMGNLTSQETKAYQEVNGDVDVIYSGVFFRHGDKIFNLKDFSLANTLIEKPGRVFARNESKDITIEVINRYHGLYTVV